MNLLRLIEETETRLELAQLQRISRGQTEEEKTEAFNAVEYYDDILDILITRLRGGV